MHFLTSVALVCAAIPTLQAAGQNLADRVAAVAQERERVERQAALAPAPSGQWSKARILGQLVYTDLSVNFEATSAKDVFAYLQSVLQLPITVRYSDDRTGEGIDPDALVTLRLDSTPALTVIEQVLEVCTTDEPCTWQLRKGFLEVGTKPRLTSPAAMELKMYPVKDLLFEMPYFDNAPNFNLNAAISQGGGGGGGGGSGGGGSGGGGGGMGGGGGGSGGGGGGSGGGGGGGGGIFGEPGGDPERTPEAERAQKLVDLILQTVEPEQWEDNGGGPCTIRYYEGVLIVRAPDFVHRGLVGYPFEPRRTETETETAGRYVDFTGNIAMIQNVGFTPVPVTGAVGGTSGGNP